MSTRPLSSLSLPHTTLSALAGAGYETLQDLLTSSPEALAQDLNLPLSASRALFSASQKSHTVWTQASFPLTQSAASMITSSAKFSSCSTPVDKLLSGGLARGHILEISGPPGTPKESLATNFVKSFVEAAEGVLFVDTQNMTSPAALNKVLCKSLSVPTHYQKLVHHVNVHTLADFMIFIYNFLFYLDSHPKIRLLVINSISFPFQSSPSLNHPVKSAFLERIKQTLTKACASRNLSVVITSQLSTKLLNADGSTGNFDTGSRAVMVPQLGPTYLPAGRTHRLLIAPMTRTSGVIRLLSSPTHQPGRSSPLQEESYSIEEGAIS